MNLSTWLRIRNLYRGWNFKQEIEHQKVFPGIVYVITFKTSTIGHIYQ